jgi:hypothetical protein
VGYLVARKIPDDIQTRRYQQEVVLPCTQDKLRQVYIGYYLQALDGREAHKQVFRH